MKKTMLEKTITMLHRKNSSLSDIARGTGFSYQWLWQVKHGKILNPGIVPIEKLYDYLKNDER